MSWPRPWTLRWTVLTALHAVCSVSLHVGDHVRSESILALLMEEMKREPRSTGAKEAGHRDRPETVNSYLGAAQEALGPV
ncbi:hypothetical protein NHX12_025219 [Muraenolepis orangiensis]|uniref:Secreted protein n=1 Tax=Muraenolepis orangiensis TaxID=630683 RepID=A0A9Q0IRD9_9TELE|nr:hypothetical protein NHX12_025219 [Muraenolepis orangiensis]